MEKEIFATKQEAMRANIEAMNAEEARKIAEDARRDAEESLRIAIQIIPAANSLHSLETGQHVSRVSEYCRLLAIEYGLDERFADSLAFASPMHDIGKIGIDPHILHKPGKLDADEYEKIKRHAELGYEFLMQFSQKPLFALGATIAYTHQEKWDGTGYPRGLQGENIPIEGRIAALADVFDALGEDRTYKKAWPLDEVLAYLEKNRGRHFEPRLVDLFFQNKDRILHIRESYAEKAAQTVVPK